MKNIIVLLTGVLVLIISVFSIISLYNYEMRQYDDIDTNALGDKIKNNENFVLYLYQEQCQPCEQVRPIINDYVEETSADYVYAINLSNSDNQVANTLETDISATPTIISFKDGAEDNIMEGSFTEEEFSEFIDSNSNIK